MRTQRILLSLGMIVFVGALAAGATGAFFSDTETSTGNTFAAGSLDLRIDSVAHVNGLVCHAGTWHPESVVVWNPQTEQNELVEDADVQAAVTAYNTANPSNVPQAGTVCTGTWELTDLGPSSPAFFSFADLKPGDNGENTISIHVDNNDAYMCAIIDNMQDVEVGTCTEPEAEDGDTSCTDAGQGELAQELHFFAWADDGDNIWEDGELPLFSNTEGPASDVLNGVVYPMFTPQSTVLPGDDTQYIGMYWCYGDITVGANTLSCNGAPVDNVSQTDSLTADITFYVEQARNNAGFQCPSLVR